MAVLAFGLVAQSAGLGAFATFAGGLVFSYVDSAFIMPGIFGSGAVDSSGPRIEDLSVQGTAEGSPTRFALGSEIKLAGQIIWSTDLTETTSESGGGGGKGGGGGGTQTNYSYALSCAIRLCDTDDVPGGAISNVRRIWANSKLLYDYDAGATEDDRIDTRYDDVRFYNGDQTEPDSLIQAAMGVLDTPAYIGSAYVVLENLQLADFGNRMPNFEFLVEISPTQTNADAIDRFCSRAGMAVSEYNTTLVSGDLLGLAIAGDQESARGIEHIMLSGNIIPSEDNGTIKFIGRETQTTVAVPIEHFGSEQHGSDSNDIVVPFWREEIFDTDLPKKVTVAYDDPACDWDRGARGAVKTNTQNQNHLRIDLPMTLNNTGGHLIAQQVLWSHWGIRDKISGMLPPSHIDKNPGDLLTTLVDGVDELIRVEKVTRGLNYMVEFEGRIEEPLIFEQNVVEAPRDCIPPSDPFNGGGTVGVMVINDHMVTPLNGDNTDYNVVWCAWRDQTGDFGENSLGHLYQSPSSGGTFRRVYIDSPSRWNRTEPFNQAKMGKLTIDLPPAGNENGGYYWDLETKIDITTLTDTWVPVTETEEDVLGGANTIVVQADDGSPEIIAFCNVTSLGSSRYECSKILRGLRGTQRNAEYVHPADTPVVFYPDLVNGHPLQTFGNREITLNPYFGNDTSDRYWKAGYYRSRVADLAEHEQNITNGTSKPYPMEDGRLIRDEDGNVFVLFRRVTRAYHAGLFQVDHYPAPAEQDSMIFELDILDPTETSVLRTKEVILPTRGDRALPGWVHPVFDAGQQRMRNTGFVVWQYSAAEQLADGYTLGDPIKCIAYQLRSAGWPSRGERGWPSHRTVIT